MGWGKGGFEEGQQPAQVAKLRFKTRSVLKSLCVCFNVYLFLSESERGRGRERERGRERIPSRPRPVSAEPDVGLELTNCEIVS